MSSHRSLDTPERAATLNRRLATEAAQREAAAEPAPHPLVALQRQVGNAQVARMLAMRAGEEEEMQAKHDLAMRHVAAEHAPPAQAKHDLAMRQDDEEEMQAKHDLATRQEEEQDEAAAKHDLTQRAGEDEEEMQAKHDLAMRQDDEEEMQAKHDLAMRQEHVEAEHAPPAQAEPEVGLEGGTLSDSLTARINARRGGGQALDDNTRTTMERSFGTSFKDVRLHSDAESDALNRSISAKAFTTGNDIFFRRDASPGDHALLAHELSHVVQQRGSNGGGGRMRVGPAGDSHEVAADSMATAVTSGAAAQAQREADEAAAQRMLVQRQAEEEKDEQAA